MVLQIIGCVGHPFATFFLHKPISPRNFIPATRAPQTPPTHKLLTTSKVHKDVAVHQVRVLDDLGHQLKRSLAIHLRGEGFVAVESLGVSDGPVVDLVEDVLQQRHGGEGVDALRRLPT